MLRSLVRVLPAFLTVNNFVQQQLRTTFILKRRIAPFLGRKKQPLKPLRTRHYIYNLVKNTNSEKQPDIEVVLTCYVDGLGNAGDKIAVRPNYAYNDLLLPGLAVYATPENVQKFQDFQVKDVKHFSSPVASMMIEALNRINLSVIMNKDTSWVLEPWHIRASFRKCGYIVPEHAIEMPLKPIKGPDMSIENKQFYVTVTVNKTEKTKVLCRIHHWSTNITEKLPYADGFWREKGEFMFVEDAKNN